MMTGTSELFRVNIERRGTSRRNRWRRRRRSEQTEEAIKVQENVLVVKKDDV
jgi:hypothetical protein